MYEYIFRVGLALLLGAIIGFERQWRQRSAGLRTNTLVSLGAASFILLSIRLTGDVGDPSRIAGQIVTGIGFLGAGVIMREGFNVQGLNTAATIWCSAAVGSLAGVGLWKEAIITASAVIIAHVLLRPLGNKLDKLPALRNENTNIMYYIKVKSKTESGNHIRILLMQYLSEDDKYIQLRSLKSIEEKDNNTTNILAEILTSSRRDAIVEKVANRLTIEPEILEVSWEVTEHHHD